MNRVAEFNLKHDCQGSSIKMNHKTQLIGYLIGLDFGFTHDPTALCCSLINDTAERDLCL